jgi:hypothetical protein
LFPLKLLAEGEGALPDDDEDDGVTPVEGVVVEPVVVGLVVGVETEPDLENSHEAQSQAMENTYEDNLDDADVDPELVEVTVAPMANEGLVSSGALILLCIRGITVRMTHAQCLIKLTRLGQPRAYTDRCSRY